MSRRGRTVHGVRSIWWIYGSNKKSSRDWPSRNMTGGAGNRDGTPRWIQPQPPASPTLPSSFTSSSTHNLPRVPLQRPREGENVLSRPPRCWVGMQSWCISPSPRLSLFLSLSCSLSALLTFSHFMLLSFSFFPSHFRHFLIFLLPSSLSSSDFPWVESRNQTTKLRWAWVCGRVIFTHP